MISRTPAEDLGVDVPRVAVPSIGDGQVRRALDVEGLPVPGAARWDRLELGEGRATPGLIAEHCYTFILILGTASNKPRIFD